LAIIAESAALSNALIIIQIDGQNNVSK